MMKNIVLIMAAGSSARMGREKQFINLLGKPLLYYTINAFEEHEDINEIIVVSNEKIIDDAKNMIRKFNFSKVSSVILGGDSRSESVKNGLDIIKEATNVLIHDGARPLVSNTLISAVVEALKNDKAVIPAIPLKDMIKKVYGAYVERSLYRPDYRAVQTPQGFSFELIKKAYEDFDKDYNYFDDAMVVEENLPDKVRFVDGDEINIKATTPSDLLYIEHLMKMNSKKC